MQLKEIQPKFLVTACKNVLLFFFFLSFFLLIISDRVGRKYLFMQDLRIRVLKITQNNISHPNWLMIKGCAHYIFASLFCISKREHPWNQEKCFLFQFESSFHSWDNKILTFQIFKCQTSSNAYAWTRNTYYWITWKVNTVW